MRHSLVCSLALAALLASAAHATPLAAQEHGTLRGVITSGTTHAPLANARVEIVSPPRVAVSGSDGRYVLRSLPAARYQLLVTAIGFAPLRRDVDVRAEGSTTLDIALTPGSILLSSVVTTATRTPEEARRVATTVNVLTPQHIESSAARESQDLLREIPGVELPRTSSLVGGTAQIVSIRGVDEGRTAVLFDGIPVNDAWGEWIDWGRVPKGMLDRVEVVEGGTSSLYGNGAMGGVISFFSRPMSPGSVRLTLEGGERGGQHISAAAGVPLVGALSASVSGDYQSGGGYTLLDPRKRGAIDHRSEIIQRNSYLRLNYAPSARLNAFATGHLFGDNRYTGTSLSFQSRQQQHVDAGVDWLTERAGALALRAWDGRQDEHQRSAAIRSNSSTCTTPSTTPRQCEDSSVTADIPSHDWGASAVWSRSTPVRYVEMFSVGADYRHYAGNYDELNFNTTCPGANCGKQTRKVWSGGQQALSGAFVQAIAAPTAPLRIELSARLDHWTNADGQSVDATAGTTRYPDSSKTAVSPRLGARYQLTSTLAVHGAYYEAFRAPNLAELYRKQVSATQITLPNPYLKPEKAEGKEVGLQWQPASWIEMKGTWYVANYRDFNVPVTLGTSGGITTRQRLNVTRTRSKGGEAYLALRPLPSLFVSGSVNYDDARIAAGPAGTVVGAHVNRVPSPKQVIRATWSSARFGNYTGIWRHEGHTTTLQGAWLDPFTVVDLQANREIVRGMSGFVSLENVGNTQYQVNLSGSGANTLISYGMPRTLRAGVTVHRD